MITLIPVEGEIRQLEHPEDKMPDFAWLNEQLGFDSGYLEFVRVWADGDRSKPHLNLVVHEEGHLRGMPQNDRATNLYYPFGFGIAGPAILLSGRNRVK